MFLDTFLVCRYERSRGNAPSFANGKYARQSGICETTEHKDWSGKREAEEQDDHQDAR